MKICSVVRNEHEKGETSIWTNASEEGEEIIRSTSESTLTAYEADTIDDVFVKVLFQNATPSFPWGWRKKMKRTEWKRNIWSDHRNVDWCERVRCYVERGVDGDRALSRREERDRRIIVAQEHFKGKVLCWSEKEERKGEPCLIPQRARI